MFFDHEKVISDDLVAEVLRYLHTVDVGLSNTQRDVALCESFGSEDSVVVGIFNNEISELHACVFVWHYFECD